MSRSKLLRALLAAASLLGAVPLMAQTPGPQAPASASAPTGVGFPFGRYLIQPLPGADQNGAGLFIEFGTSTTKVFSGADLVETHGSAVEGDTWHIFELTGECLDDGSYHWHFADGVLTFQIIADPCTQRASSVSSVRLVKQP